MRFFKEIQLILAFCLVVLPTLKAIAGDNICLEPNYPELIYDPGNPKTLAPGTSATIKIIGGVPPYYWSSSGPQYQFAKAQTDINQVTGDDGRTNIITAVQNAKACGKVTLTITDSRPDPMHPDSKKPQIVHGYLNEDYQPLKYPYPENESEQVAEFPGGTAVITISGGTPPYTYRLSDSHFSFSTAPGDIISSPTNSISIIVLNIDNGCGTNVTITDQCSSVSGFIRGTGQWEHIKTEYVNVDANGCILNGDCCYSTIVITNGSSQIAYDIDGDRYECCTNPQFGPPIAPTIVKYLGISDLNRMYGNGCGTTAADVYYVYSKISYAEWKCNSN